jgi:hypothetical protein
MPGYTLEHMMFSVFLVGFLIVTGNFAVQYAGAQVQVTLRVDLKNVVLYVKQELLDTYRAVDATGSAGFTVPVAVPRTIQGSRYTILLFANGTLRGLVQQATFDTQLPSLTNCAWSSSIFRSGGEAIRITGRYASGTVTVSISP